MPRSHVPAIGLMTFAICLMSGCVHSPIRSPLHSFEQSTVYQPVRFPEGNWQSPGLEFEDAWFRAKDGTSLHGWFVPHQNPRAIVLFAHGNAGNLSHRAETLRILNERHQLSVMIFDYRGFGRSEGSPSEKGSLQDARAARKWLSQRTGVAEKEIVLLGRSLGGGVMVDLAARDDARGLVLASTFSSLPDVARHAMPLVPVRLLMTNRFNSLSKIENYHGPLLQSHGDQDNLIPLRLANRLFKAANGPKRFITIEGGDHNSPQSEEYRVAFDEFIDSLR